jgi:hypothetical protein
VLVATVLSTIGASVGIAAQPAAAATPTATLLVAPDGGGIVHTGRGLGISVAVTNTGSAQLPHGRLTFSLDDAPVAGTTTLLTSIATPPEALQGQLTSATADVPALEVGASERVRATLGKKDLTTLLSGASGARRLYVQYQPGAGVRVVAVSSVVKIASGSQASVGLGVVIPVLAPAGTTGLVDTAAQQQLTGAEGAWTHALHAAASFPAATVALDPAVIASIRIAGAGAPPEALAFLDALGRLPNQTVRLPYADGDETLERAAGRSGTLEPSSFAGVALPSSNPGAPTTAPKATSPVSTAAADLTDWNWSEQTVAWPVPHTASAGDVGAFGRNGTAVLLPSDDIRDTAARRAAGPLTSARSTTVLVADTTTSTLLARAAAGGAGGDAALATLTGLLATAAVTGETTALLGTAGRADAPGLDRVLTTLGHQPWIQGRSLSQLASGPSVPVSLPNRSVAPARTALAKTLLSGDDDLQQLGTAIPSGRDTVLAPQRLVLMGLLSASWSSDDAGWRAAVGSAADGFRAVIGKVHLVNQTAPNIIGNDGTFRAVVANELPTPVKVVIHAAASNGAVQFTGSASATVTVPAGSRARAQLTFRTIRNGSTDLTLRLTTPRGTPIDELTSRGATVRAGFDTIIAVVLLTALGLLLALGVYRNVKRRRQPRGSAA